MFDTHVNDFSSRCDHDDALDALLAHARSYRAPFGLEDAVMEAIRLETARRVPWYARWQAGAAAAVIACGLALSLARHGSEIPALDDTLLVEASLSCLGDSEMIQAVYGVAAYNGAALAQDDLALCAP